MVALGIFQKNRVLSASLNASGSSVRTDWHDFPKVDLIEPSKTIATHPSYDLAKQGNLEAALTLVDDLLDVESLSLIHI